MLSLIVFSFSSAEGQRKVAEVKEFLFKKNMEVTQISSSHSIFSLTSKRDFGVHVPGENLISVEEVEDGFGEPTSNQRRLRRVTKG
jgi:hypothetical protein